MLKKLFILSVKYIPVIEMAGIFINNTCYYFNFYTISNLLDLFLGDALIHNAFLIICSILFCFCLWHRLIIISNIINIILIYIDKEYKINITDTDLLLLYYTITVIFILIATYVHVKNNKNDKRKAKNIERCFDAVCTKYRCW